MRAHTHTHEGRLSALLITSDAEEHSIDESNTIYVPCQYTHTRGHTK